MSNKYNCRKENEKIIQLNLISEIDKKNDKIQLPTIFRTCLSEKEMEEDFKARFEAQKIQKMNEKYQQWKQHRASWGKTGLDNTDIAEILDNILDDMKKDGVLKPLVEKYDIKF